MLSTRERKEKGFTLVELLVVIAIIAVITAIAVPAFINQRQKAKDASVLADVKNLANAVQTALIDCPAADVFQFRTGSNPLPLEMKSPNGNITGPFTSWHTLSYDTFKAHGQDIKLRTYTYAPPAQPVCLIDGITVSEGNYLHLTEVDGFENNRFLIYGWNPDGGKYNGATITIAGDVSFLPANAKDSAVVYDSTTGGISK